MGFHKGAWATCWGAESKSDTLTVVRLSTSRKDKQNGTYEQDFSGFVSFVGTSTAQKAMSLKERDRIQLGDVDVTTKYDAGKNTTYTNYKCFSFTKAEDKNDADSNTAEPQPNIDEGVDEDRLPF